MKVNKVWDKTWHLGVTLERKKGKGWHGNSTGHAQARLFGKRYPIKYVNNIATAKYKGHTLKGKQAYGYVFMSDFMNEARKRRRKK